MREILRDIEATAYDTPASWLTELHFEQRRLGNAPALIVRGSNLLCGATGNCQTWVFRRLGKNWRLLLGQEEAVIADGLSFGGSKTHAVEDLTVTANSSATSTSRQTYKFDGRVYRKTAD